MSILSYVSTHIDAYCRMSVVKGVVGGLAGESEGGGVHYVQASVLIAPALWSPRDNLGK